MTSSEEEKSSWFSRLRAGLSKTSSGITEGIGGIFTKRKLDDAMLEELEELLIAADMGAGVAAKLVAEFSKGRYDKEISPEEVKEALAAQIAALLEPVAKPLDITPAKPHVILVVGVNGNGKTTTIGKMARQLKHFGMGGDDSFSPRGEGKDEGDGATGRVAETSPSPHPSPLGEREPGSASIETGFKVMLAAGDTFRAAAVNQLKIWGERAGIPVIAGEEGADPASIAYRAVEEAKRNDVDVLLIDTAGRLHNQQNLMQELEKIIRVMRKVDETAPHTVLQVLDGTTGQNALAQVEAFQKLVNVSGLVVTKLDGTAKGGVVVALAERFKLPIHAIGVGEGIADLKDFEAEEFARSLMGL